MSCGPAIQVASLSPPALWQRAAAELCLPRTLLLVGSAASHLLCSVHMGCGLGIRARGEWGCVLGALLLLLLGCSGWFFAFLQKSKPRKRVSGYGQRDSPSMPSCTKVRAPSCPFPALHLLRACVSSGFQGGLQGQRPQLRGEEGTEGIIH